MHNVDVILVCPKVYLLMREIQLFNVYDFYKIYLPVTVAERFKACTVFARSEAGIVGSNTTQGMDV
jgi:hypothetical protein